MADNLGSIAWLFLQENVLPQWQQKIADAENLDRPNYSHFGAERIFRTKCDFLQVLDLLIFRQVARLLMPVPLPFSPSNKNITWSNRLFCEAFFFFKN